MKKNHLILLFSLFCLQLSAQSIDHWETIINYTDLWHYKVGDSAPPTDWKSVSFDTSTWVTGIGGIGYGDDDDNTQIAPTTSLYIRRNFQVIDPSKLLFLLLHADYDDAFVAYINGQEIARNGIGTVGVEPMYSDFASDMHEAVFFNGGVPESYVVPLQHIANLLQTGTNTLAIQIHNASATSSDLSSIFFLSAGLSDAAILYNPTPTWFYSPVFSTDLPLLVIETEQSAAIQDATRVKAHLGIVDKGQGNTIFDDFTDYDGAISIEIRGTSSQMYPKKGYGFETQLADGSNNNIELLGMPKENDWVLNAPYADKTLLRNRLAYQMGSTTGRYTPRTRLCELVVNGDYRGVYLLTEKIKRDKNRVDIDKLKPEDIAGDDLTGGYIFKIDWDNQTTVLDGWVSFSNPSKFYAYQDPSYEEIMPEQRDYLKTYITMFENQLNSPNYLNTYKDFVDVDSWIDYVLITEIGKHIDAYKLSFYMYKNRSSKGGKIHFGPQWDYNIAFGNFDFACSPDPFGWSYDFQGTCDFSQPFWVKKLLSIPQVQHQAQCRWTALRAGALHTDSIMAYLDSQIALLDKPKDRNFERWPVIGEYVWPNNYVGQSYAEEIGYLKNWVKQRLNWMDSNMLGNCASYVATESPKTEETLQVYPNPATTFLRIDGDFKASQENYMDWFDFSGKKVASFPLRATSTDLQLADFAAGLYFYKVRSGDTVWAQGKVVVVY